jgi:hypothetical protein
VALGVVVLLAAIVTLAARAARPDVVITGPTDDAAVGKSALSKLEFASSTADAEWLLNGRRVTPSRQAGRSVWRPKDLADGDYTLVVRRSGRLLSAKRTLRFTVDTRAPLLKLDAPATARRGATSRVEGATRERRDSPPLVPTSCRSTRRDGSDSSSGTARAGSSSSRRMPPGTAAAGACP